MFMSLEGLRLSGSAVHSLIPTWGVHQVPGRGALKCPGAVAVEEASSSGGWHWRMTYMMSSEGPLSTLSPGG